MVKRKRKAKSLNVMAAVAALIALIGLALTIVGIVTDWVTASEYGGTFGEIADFRNVATEKLGLYEGFDAAYSFAIITIVLSAITFIGSVMTMLIRPKFLKFITVIAAAVTVVSAIVALICTYTLCGNTWYSLVEATPAIGAWLLTIGGVLCGLAGAYATLNS